jgi:hypothetical protein
MLNITGVHGTLAASQSNGYVWELSDINLASGVDTDTAGSELPIVNSMTTTGTISGQNRLVTSFFGGNKQDGTVAPQSNSVITQFNGLQFGGGGGGTVAGGVGNAGPAGEQTLGWVAATGGLANGVSSELAFAFDAPGTVIPFMRLNINRDTGAMTLVRVGDTLTNVVGYSITSNGGSLNQASWNSISDDNRGVGGGQWTELTQPGSTTDLSEFTFDESTPDGGQLVAGSLTLGNAGAWTRTFLQDVAMTVKVDDGSPLGLDVAVQVVYQGTALLRSDFNADGMIDGDDMEVFLDNYNTTFPANTTDVASYASGDIDGNQAVNLADWRLFKSDYNNFVNGSGEGASIVNGQVPEPTTVLMFGVAVGALGLAGRRRRTA